MRPRLRCCQSAEAQRGIELAKGVARRAWSRRRNRA